MFGCKRTRRHKLVTPALLAGLALLLPLTGCLPAPQQIQTVSLFDQLVMARARFGQEPPPADAACNMVGNVQTRLWGEPGLAEIRPAWPELRDASAALQSICGRSMLLAQPTNGSLFLDQARQRWQQGIQHEMGVACDSLRTAAVDLARPTPC